MSVKVITDSTSDIEDYIKEELDINALSLYVSFDGENTIKETQIENEEFYKMMEEKGIPTSSQPSIPEIYKGMKDLLSEGHDLFCIFLSSKLSGTYTTAFAVATELMEEYPDRKIYIMDSKSTSMQLGYAAIVAARAAKGGKTLDQVVEVAEKNIERSRFLFIPDNLKYLEKGGRIGGASALLGNILRIVPILTVRDGRADIVRKIRTKKRAVKSMIDELMKDHKNSTIEEIVVHHINSYDEAVKLSEKIEKRLKMRAEIVDIGPIVGLHVGPGAIGTTYYTREKLENN